ncbi:hypothetical protein MMPV_000566 [Pyropia vietnamensis]
MDGDTMSAIAQCEAALARTPSRDGGGGNGDGGGCGGGGGGASGGDGGGGGGGPRLDGGVLLDALINASAPAGGGNTNGSTATPLRAKRPAFGGLTIRLPASAADGAPAGSIFPHVEPPSGAHHPDLAAADTASATAAAAAVAASAVRQTTFEGDWLDFCSDGMPGSLDEVPHPPPAVASSPPPPPPPPPPPSTACGLEALSWAAGAAAAAGGWAAAPATPAPAAPHGGWAAPAATAGGQASPPTGHPVKMETGGGGKRAPTCGPCLPVSPLTPRANDPDAILDDAADCHVRSGGGSGRGCVSPYPFPSLNSPMPPSAGVGAGAGWPSTPVPPSMASTPSRPTAADVAAARRKARMSARRGAAASGGATPTPATASLDSMDYDGGEAPCAPHPSSGIPLASPECGDGAGGIGGGAPVTPQPGRPVDKKAARAMRNREAALRSRLAAKARLASLEAEHAALTRRVANAAARVTQLKGRGRELLAGLGPIDGLVGDGGDDRRTGGGDSQEKGDSTTARLVDLFREADAASEGRGTSAVVPCSPLPPAATPF